MASRRYVEVTGLVAACLLEPGDLFVMFTGHRPQGLAVVTERLRWEKDSHGKPVIGTTEGRYWLDPGDMIHVRALGAFRALGSGDSEKGAGDMTWGTLLEPTPLLLDDYRQKMPRAARSWLRRCEEEEGFLVHERMTAIDQVLWKYSDGVVRPGNFRMHLIDTMAAADEENLARLAVVYPDLALAIWLARYQTDGIASLSAIAARVHNLEAEEER